MIKFIHPTKRTLQMWHLHKFHVQKITKVTSFMFGEEIITEEVEDIFLNVEIKKEAMIHTEEFFGETFTFIHPENIDFWGLGGLQGFVHQLRETQINKEMILLNGEILKFDDKGEVICPIRIFSKSELEADKKMLMAHVMVEMGIFKSVGDAKRNGWDKPIELGEFCVTKRKIKFEVIS